MKGRSTPNVLRDAFRRVQFIVYLAIVFSFFYNLLRLIGPLFIILVYNRVLPSRSEATLVALFLLVVLFLIVRVMLDYSRRRILARFGARFQEIVEDHIFSSARRDIYLIKNVSNQKDGLDEVDGLRGFFHSSALTAILDFLWCPIFLIPIFLISWVIGWVVIVGVILVMLVMAVRMVFAKAREERYNEANKEISELKEILLASSDVIQSQHMTATYNERWIQARRRSRDRAIELNDWNAWFSTLSTHLAKLMQYSVLAAGAYLALNGALTMGAMVACMFLAVRVFYPAASFMNQLPRIREAIADWKSLDRILKAGKSTPAHWEVGVAPTLSLSELVVRSPLTKQKILRAEYLEVEPGSAVEIVGKSGAGKSVLAAALLGRIPRSGGKILFGDVDIERLSITVMAQAFGYVPQHVAFVNGTIEENIARLRLEVDRDRLVEVAKMAQVHDLILALPNGYHTPIDAAGSSFSKSERHQIALARALYSDPKVLIVDEPDQTFRDGLSGRLWVASFLDRGGILIILSRLGLKKFRPMRSFSLENGLLEERKPDQNDMAKSISNVVKLSEQKYLEGKVSEQKYLESKIGNAGDEN